MTTPEVVRVYIGSFWNSAVMAPSENEALIKKEQKDLINDLHSLPKNSLVRKVNEMIKRVKQARVHALLLNHLRDQMPTMFGKSAKQAKLIQFLNLEFTKVQQQYLIPTSDFPEYENFREILKTIEISNLPKLSTKTLESLNEVLTTELPELLKVFSSVCHPLRVLSDNMVEEKMAYLKEHQNLTLQDDGSSKSLTIFQSLGPDHGLLSKSKVIQFLATVELSAREMEEIWTFADQDSDGLVNQTEFISALKLVNSKVKGTENN